MLWLAGTGIAGDRAVFTWLPQTAMALDCSASFGTGASAQGQRESVQLLPTYVAVGQLGDWLVTASTSHALRNGGVTITTPL